MTTECLNHPYEDGGAGKVAQAPYEAFRDFLKEIVAQVNALATGDSTKVDGLDTEMGDSSEPFGNEEDGAEVPF